MRTPRPVIVTAALVLSLAACRDEHLLDGGAPPAGVCTVGTSVDATPSDAGTRSDGAVAMDGALPLDGASPLDGATVQRAAKPSFGCWAWGKPDVTAIARAGFAWFETGYPGTLAATDNDYLSQHGTRPFAYINSAEVPNDDTSLQSQIGSFWSSIALCQNTGWNTTVVDVRDARWQGWLVTRANQAYDLGNRGIKWDVAGVENLCNGWASQGGATAAQQAVDAFAATLRQIKSQHPDLKFIVNQGFALATQSSDVVDGLELENLINYNDANAPDPWSTDLIHQVSAIHANTGMPVFDLEYIDLFGCSDTTCSYASQLYDQIVALDWIPYLTKVDMNIEGRGLGITPPW